MFPLTDSIKPPRIPFLNLVIIILNAVIFFKELTAPNPNSFIGAYSLIPSRINFSDIGSLYPFVTAMFIHGGFLHISSNMWFLWVFGKNIETHLKWYLYPILFLIAGLIGNVGQYLLMPHSNIPMLGASGAVAGVLGAYYSNFPFVRIKTLIPIFFIPLIIELPAIILLGYWFFLQLFSGAASVSSPGQGGIAFFSHIGGFATGILFAKIFMRSPNLSDLK